MNKERLAKEIYTKCFLEGNFILRSGKESKFYFDKYLFESDPYLLNEITSQLLTKIPDNIDILAGLELGGIPIATALSLKSKMPVIFVRKKTKSYGTCKIAEGIDFKKSNVCIIEDVVTSGGQIIESCRELRRLGVNISNALCVIQREEIAAKKLKEHGLKLITLFTLKDLEKVKK